MESIASALVIEESARPPEHYRTFAEPEAVLDNRTYNSVKQGDLVHPSAATPLTAGTVVHLARGKTLSVRLDGKDQSHYIRAATVADVVRVLEVIELLFVE